MWNNINVVWCIFGYLTRISECVKDDIDNKGSEDELESRIVGGKPVAIEKIPSDVILINMRAHCSGSILTSHAVLTAAHCFKFNKNIEDMTIIVGSRFRVDPTAKRHRVAYVVVHEDFNKPIMFSCDVAMVFVKTSIGFGRKAKRAVIVNNNKWMDKKQRNFTVTGWGMKKYNGSLSDALLMVQLRYITKKECKRMHKKNFTDDMFCLYGDGIKDSCKGDSGGGVFWHDQLVGLVSHGDGCAQRNKPSVYTNVWFFRRWIKKTLDHYNKYHGTHIKPGLNKTKKLNKKCRLSDKKKKERKEKKTRKIILKKKKEVI